MNGREPAGREGPGQLGLRQSIRRHGLGGRWPRVGGRPLEPPDPLEHGVQRQSADELHDVEVGALMLADPEDRDDVGVVQPRGGLGLALEPDEELGVEQPVVAQHLQRHAAAQRLLLGLVDDPHPAAADLAEQTEVAQPFAAPRPGPGSSSRRCSRWPRPGRA